MAGFVAPKTDIEETTKSNSGGFIAPTSDIKPVTPVEEKSFGKKVGESLKKVPAAVADIITGTVELPLAMTNNAISSTAATVAGPVVQAFGGDGMKARKYIQDNFTYHPKSESGKASLDVVGKVGANTIGRVGDFTADVAEGAGADPLTTETYRDVANIITGVGAAKVLAPTARAAYSVAKKTGEVAGAAGKGAMDIAKTAGEIYTPEAQALATGLHLASGDIVGATIQGGIATARKMYANKKAPASVSEVMTNDIRPQGITTKAEAAAIKDIIAERRAAVAARNAAQGRNNRSTMYDTE